MTNRTKGPYIICGYDKDSDLYVRLATVYDELPVAISVADHMATLGLRRKTTNEPFDWIEVGTDHSCDRHHVAPCT